MRCSSAPLKALNLPMFSMYCTWIRLRPLKIERSHLRVLSAEINVTSALTGYSYHGEAARAISQLQIFHTPSRESGYRSTIAGTSVPYKLAIAVSRPRGETSLAYGDNRLGRAALPAAVAVSIVAKSKVLVLSVRTD